MKNYAFIDANNLYVGSRKQGIYVDYRKLRLYLKNQFQVQKAFLFIGYDPRHQSMYDAYEKMGYTCVFKPTILRRENGKRVMKGNVDAELVLHSAAIEYDNYDQAVIISGDGDFTCLIKYLLEKGKLRHIICPTGRYSSLLQPHLRHITKLSQFKQKISR